MKTTVRDAQLRNVGGKGEGTSAAPLDDILDAIDALPRMRHCIRIRRYCPRDIMAVMLYDPWIHFVPSFAL